MSIRRQSILSSIFMYIGVILGGINATILFPQFLSTVEYGFIRWLLLVGSVIGILARIGMRDVTFKFFPYFKDKEKNHHGFLSVALLIPLIGILFGALIIWGFKDFLISFYGKKESFLIISKYYWWLLPMLLFDVYFNVLTAYSTSLMKAAIPIFFRDLFVRLLALALLLLFWKNFLDFGQFVQFYTFIYGAQCIGMLIYLYKIGQLKLKWDLSKFKQYKDEILPYAGFAFLSGGATYLVVHIDGLMVSTLAPTKLKALAIFSVFAYVGTLVIIPARAIMNVSLPVIANAWKENDISKIDSIYKKTASTQLVIGLGLLVLVWANIDHFINFLAYIKGDNEYAVGKYVALFIGLAKLIDGATGINGGIIITSKYYRFDLFFVLLLVVLAITTNYFLIPKYDITGAAIATFITASAYNLGKYAFVKWRFKLDPFTPKTWLTLLLGISLFGINYLLPSITPLPIDFLYRSIILGGLYGAAVLYFNLSPEITNLVNKLLKRVRK